MWTLYLLGCAWIAWAWYMRYTYGDVYQADFFTEYNFAVASERATLFTVLTFIPMTIIRWIATGKHFWQKP